VGQVDDGLKTGIPWLTGPQRDFLAHLLAHLLTLSIQQQLPGERSYREVSDALGDIADEGMIDLHADDENVWVYICGRSIVHAARDWLEWMTPRWHAAGSASN
jgi:hypothetical protein